MALIELNTLGKRYYTTPGPRRSAKYVDALRDVTLSIPAQSAWAVVGPNGAGKSTLFSLLLGFLKPTSGQVQIDGLEPRAYTRTHGAAYLPERFRLPGGWPVRGALEALARLERLPDAAARTAAVLEQTGLAEHADQKVGALSRGLLQRLGLAQSLLAAHSLVVLDEPTEGLDPIWRLRLREIISELRADGRTLLIASHDLNEVERFVDQVVLLDQGTIRETFAAAPDQAEPRRYRIELSSAVADVQNIFPKVDQSDGRSLIVTVTDANDLSARLAALLAAGAIVESVTPADRLEQRVRAALDREPRA
ncbi:MAG TPA: ABC transporter ATP-binding protein [Longimicrobiales bacterium]|nr:ABC transporter ATP-binding protein [Longimicrobiales bacterium]